MRVAVIGWEAQETNQALVPAWRSIGIEAFRLTPDEALCTLAAGDVAVGRLDVLPTLDGVEPRFGSWGKDVYLCRDRAELSECLAAVWATRWFRRDGALVQELVPPRRYDVRVIVAGGRVIGAGRRTAAGGEWRTNVSLGGDVRRFEPDRTARALALAAAAAVGMDLVGVDLLPLDDAYTVLELNGAVDFDERYSLSGGDVYLDAAAGLGLRESSVGGNVRHVGA
jgi:ribosomal protein S6-L-glutamate ligase RimK-like protein